MQLTAISFVIFAVHRSLAAYLTSAQANFWIWLLPLWRGRSRPWLLPLDLPRASGLPLSLVWAFAFVLALVFGWRSASALGSDFELKG